MMATKPETLDKISMYTLAELENPTQKFRLKTPNVLSTDQRIPKFLYSDIIQVVFV